MEQIVNHIRHPELRSDNKLYVIGVMSNHQGWHSRVRLARQWICHMLETPNIELIVVETVFKNKSYELRPEKGEYMYLPLVTHHHGWIKESMINAGCRHAIHVCGAKNLAFIDMDVFFENKNSWVQSTLHQLQITPFMQPWSHAIDLGPNNDILLAPESFGSVQQTGKPLKIAKSPQYSYPHPGYAWCMTSEFFLNLPGKGLLDFCVVGNADWHMAWSAVGRAEETLKHNYAPSYKARVLDWQRAAMRMTHGQVGFIEGFIKHPFHGSKVTRYYIQRAQILDKCAYDPDKHIKYDGQGLICINNNQPLEHEMQKYGLSRKEDSIDK